MERHEITNRNPDRTEAPKDGSQIPEDVLDTTSEEEETSSSGSSSGNDEDSGEDGEGAEDDRPPATSNVPPTPSTKKPKLTSPPTALKSRLTSFLPQLQQANADLEKDPDAATRRVDNVADSDEQYIEMNLGLGVLNAMPTSDEARNFKTSTTDDSDSSENESSSPSGVDAGAELTQLGIIDKLKGVKPAKRKIEEVS